ncbi:ETEC_3214 domain-containing protein [Photobacterium sp. DNB22_13_2]
MQNDESVLNSKSNFWIKMHSISLAVVAIMLSLGQWNDTKDAVEMIYESIITNWTNEIEYEQLSKIKVGQTEGYIEELMGVAQASKKSKLNPDITFFYYGEEKYLLTIAIKQNRVAGYSVTALKDHFAMTVPFTELTLLDTPISALNNDLENYFTDNGNLDYYAESYSLGRNAMFYNLGLGVVDYGLMGESASQRLQAINHKLNSGGELLFSDLTALRAAAPNFYAISELPADLMVEAMLTRFEFTAFFN